MKLISRGIFIYGTNLARVRQVHLISKRSASGSGTPKPLRFDGQTAVITGAGRGLGREYALLLARRGANVVVNDFGGARTGQLSGSEDEKSVADDVVKEIEKNGGTAIANYESISDEDGSRRLVEMALDKFNRIDILINNAGILRDKSFVKMSLEDWDQVHQIHLRGSFLVSKASWLQFRRQEYGKIIMTGSTSGLYGNFGQANYSAAKMGLVGLSNTLAIEGRKSNIHCNVVVPMAASRLTHDILPADLADQLNPVHVAPLVAWLCHKDCDESGSVYEAAGQWFGRHQLLRSKGKLIPGISEDVDNSIEKIASNWDEIRSFDNHAKLIDNFNDHLSQLIESFEIHK